MLPINPARIPQIYAEALKKQAAGQHDAAVASYRQILSVRPRLAEVHFQLGRIALTRKRPEEALRHLERAAALKPQVGDIWAVMADALLALEDPAETARSVEAAKRLKVPAPVLLAFQTKLGLAGSAKASLGGADPAAVKRVIGLLQKGDAAAAERGAAALVAAHGQVALLRDILASAQAACGRFEAAEASWRKAVSLDPGMVEARLKLGRFLLDRGRADEALPHLDAAARLDPKRADAAIQLGMARAALGRSGAAIDALRRGLVLRPGDREARRRLASLLVETQSADEGLALLDALCAEDPADMEAGLSRAWALAATGRDAAALEAFSALAAAHPDAIAPEASRAQLLTRLGRFDEAGAAYRAALARDPANGLAWYGYVAGRKLTEDAPEIAEMMRLWDDVAIPDASRAPLGFALAKAMEDTGRHDRVFTYLRPANDLVRAHFPSTIGAQREAVHEIMAACADVDFAAPEGEHGFAPIFVTGVPRSGTTLVEQILASHSTVTGGGELGVARHLAQEALSAAGDAVAAIDWRVLGARIEAEMRGLFPGADRITDKSVQTYLLFGPIHRALPSARLVLVERDPRDTALSMYKTYFDAGRQLHTYSLTDLAEHYRLFREIVDFWEARMPGVIIRARYEDLIADPEVETRRLVAACGLTWEDACLSFHETRRRVDTASVAQVRQPIYKTSMQAWRRYEAELAEFVEALGDLAPKE
ncbi:MAG: tetratricopeptide repeat-containing sulfotransferase family protein [Paracoccaceae bacterium]